MASTVSTDWYDLFEEHKSANIEPSTYTYKSLDNLTAFPKLSFLRHLIWIEIRKYVQNDSSAMTQVSHEDLEGPGRIYIGGMHHALNDALLASQDISAVITIHPRDMLAWDDDDANYGVRRYGTDLSCPVKYHLMVPLEDNSTSNILHHFDDTYGFIREHVGSGRNVLIHCKSGRSRSVAVLIAYMLRRHYEKTVSPKQLSLDEARDELNEYREAITDSLRQQRLPVIIIMDRFQTLLQLYDLQLIRHPDYERKKELQQGVGGKVNKKEGGAILKIAVAIVFFKNSQKPMHSAVQRFFEVNEAYFHELEGGSYNGRSYVDSRQVHRGIMRFYTGYAKEYNIAIPTSVAKMWVDS